MTRRTINRLSALLVLVIVGGLAGGWWWMAIGRYPLRGDRSHDFGDVAIVERTASVDHTFTLHNRTSRPVVIEAVRASCGCTRAEASTRNVEPGGTVEIEVTLTLSHAGRKRSSIGLVIKDFGVQTLFIEGVGRKGVALSPVQPTVRLHEGSGNPLTMVAEIEDNAGDDEPPVPTARAPEGVEVTFVAWELMRAADAKTARPARWRARFDIALVGEELEQGAEIIVRIGGEELAVPIVKAAKGR